jgi:multidrug resistance efflux pump
MPSSRTCSVVASMCLVAGVLLQPPAVAQDPDPKPRAIELPGQVVPYAQADLHALVAGVVQLMPADVGDSVKKDQVLAKLDVPELLLEVEQKRAREILAQTGIEQAKRNVDIVEAAHMLTKAHTQEAEAAVARAKAEHEFCKTRHDRLKRLVQEKAVSSQELEESAHQLNASRARLQETEAKVKLAEFGHAEALAKRDRAVADVKAAEAAFVVARTDTRRAEAMLRLAEVRAPFDGVILRRKAVVGEAVGLARGKEVPLFTLAQLDRVRIVFHVPEKHLRSLTAGTPVKVRFDLPTERVIEAKVARLGVALDAKAKERTLRAEIELPNPRRELLPGSSATVVIRTEKE